MLLITEFVILVVLESELFIDLLSIVFEVRALVHTRGDSPSQARESERDCGVRKSTRDGETRPWHEEPCTEMQCILPLLSNEDMCLARANI